MFTPPIRPKLRHTAAAAMLLAGLALAPVATAQSTLPAPTTAMVPYAIESGPRDNPGADWRLAYAHQVHLPGANSLRVHFAAADLPAGSYLLITSLRDGEQQRLDADRLALWGSATAYFNGDTVLVELHAAPGALGCAVRLERVEAGFPEARPGGEGGLRGDPGLCGICTSDARVPTNFPFAGRLMPVGCSATIICEDNTAVTAGHCMGDANILQFNVPASLSNCDLVNPPVEDQFPVIPATRIGANNGVGDDWGVFRLGPNGAAQGPFERYGQLRRPATAMPAVGVTVTIFGYGADSNCVRNHVQQRSIGALNNVGSTALQFNADVRAGSSGSALLANNEIIGVVSHCSTVCGGNIATRIDVPAFRNAINATMTCDNRVEVRAVADPAGSPLAVPVAASPADLFGNAAGVTPFDRFFNAGSTVSFTAPQASGDLCFWRWQINGVNQPGGRTLGFTYAGPVTITARYSLAACCPADWNRDSLVNSSDLSAFISSWLASIQQGNLIADFNGDNLVNSSDLSAFISAWLDAVSAGGC